MNIENIKLSLIYKFLSFKNSKLFEPNLISLIFKYYDIKDLLFNLLNNINEINIYRIDYYITYHSWNFRTITIYDRNIIPLYEDFYPIYDKNYYSILENDEIYNNDIITENKKINYFYTLEELVFNINTKEVSWINSNILEIIYVNGWKSINNIDDIYDIYIKPKILSI
jgi:hypothetical protein